MSGRQGVGAIKSSVAGINVNCEPGKPYIVQAKEGEEVVVEAGQEVELHCQSQGGKPPAEIQWWDDAGTRIVADMRGENLLAFKPSFLATISSFMIHPLL